jgi:hypothetical protein
MFQALIHAAKSKILMEIIMSKHLHLHTSGDDDYNAIYMSESVTIGLRSVQTFLKEDPITSSRNLPTQENF